MPQPPVTMQGYYIVGGPSGAALFGLFGFTWGQFRFPLGFIGSVLTYTPQSATYDNGFTTTDGGLFRLETESVLGDYPVRFEYIDFPLSVPPDGTFALKLGNPSLTDGFLDIDDCLQLTGQLVTMTGGTFTTTSDFHTIPPGAQTVASGLGTITSIGNLATF